LIWFCDNTPQVLGGEKEMPLHNPHEQVRLYFWMTEAISGRAFLQAAKFCQITNA